MQTNTVECHLETSTSKTERVEESGLTVSLLKAARSSQTEVPLDNISIGVGLHSTPGPAGSLHGAERVGLAIVGEGEDTAAKGSHATGRL